MNSKQGPLSPIGDAHDRKNRRAPATDIGEPHQTEEGAA
jgi:hypothetical protein